jgi:hypothetical protein
MRGTVSALGLLLSTGCFIAVDPTVEPDAGAGVDAAVEPDARLDGGPKQFVVVATGCRAPSVPGDASTPFKFGCVDFPGNAARCQDATLEQCNSQTFALAAGDGHLAWTTRGGGVWVEPVAGGAPVALVPEGEDYSPRGSVTIVVRGGFVYWGQGAASGPGSVYRAPVFGGTPQLVTGHPSYPDGLAVDDTWVYVSSMHSGLVERAPLAGGPSQRLASGENNPRGLVVHDGWLYWGAYWGCQVRRMSAAGGAPTTLFDVQPALSRPWKLAIAGGFLYWSEDGEPGTIERGPLAGAAMETVVTGSDREFATDGEWLFWVRNDASSQTLLRTRVGGATEVMLGLWPAGVVAIDATTVYFGSAGVWSLPR